MTDTFKTRFEMLSTAILADACLQLKHPIRQVPAGIRAVLPGQRIIGRVFPVRHYGSVDVFLEAFEATQPGDVVVIDNDGRMEEGCIGDLIVLEAQFAGLAGLVVWGVHRDTRELEAIRFPVFSYGAYAAGPQRLDTRDAQPGDPVRFGHLSVSRQDMVVADEDGVLFMDVEAAEEIFEAAMGIYHKEREQAALLHQGRSLREQLQVAAYLEQRDHDPAYTFRRHLQQINAAIEK